MNNKISIIFIQDGFPFGGQTSMMQQIGQIEPRKIIQNDSQPRPFIKEKIRMLKTLGHEYLIRLISAREEANNFILTYENVPFKFKNKFQHQSDEVIEKIKRQFVEMVQILADHCIEHDLNFQNVGINNQNNLKYYLGFNFKIDRSMNKQEMKERYRQQITTFFKSENLTRDNKFYPKERAKMQKNCLLQTMDTVWKEENMDIKIPALEMKKSAKSFNFSNRKEDDVRKMKNSITIQSTEQIDLSPQKQKRYSEKIFNDNKLIKDPLLETKIKKSMFAMKQLIAKTGKNSSLKGYLTDRVNTCSPEKMQSSPKSPTLPKFNSGSAENKQEYSITLNKIQLFKNQQKSESPEKRSFLEDSPENVSDRLHQEYVALATKDKYCQQFLNFLEYDLASPTKKAKIRQSLSNQKNSEMFNQLIESETSNRVKELHNRVRNAISNSMRLMSGLRTKEIVRFQ